MINVNEIPRSGTLIISVYFDGYQDNYPNDSRRKLRDVIDDICSEKNLSVKIIPITFSLIKTVSGGKNKAAGRATGAQYQYGYSNMTSDDLKIIYQNLKSRQLDWWTNIQFLLADDIEGLE